MRMPKPVATMMLLKIIKKQPAILEMTTRTLRNTCLWPLFLLTGVLKNNSEATTLYRELKERYPRSQYGFEADKYLARLGVYDTEKK
jgi:hypothetical protein